MPTTLHYLRASHLRLPAQLGRATVAQVVEASDALSCVRTVCAHVFTLGAYTMPDCHAKTLARLGLSLSLAEAVRVLALWRKWARRSDVLPTVSDVQHFLFALRDTLNT